MATEVLDILIRERGGAGATASILGIGKGAQAASAALGLLRNALLAVGVGIGVKAIIELSDAFTTLENRLRVTTNSAEELAGVETELFRIANDTRTSIETTATLYQRFRLATLSLGASQRDVLTVIEALNKAGKISGANAIEQSAALIQLSQGFNRGTVSGDEFRSVSEQLPVILDIVGKSLGKTRAEVVQMGLNTKLSAKIIFDALLQQAPNINKQYEQVGATFTDVFTIVRNELILTVGTIQNFFGKTGVTKSLEEAAKGISETLINAFAAGIEGAGALIGEISDLIDAISFIDLTAKQVEVGIRTVVLAVTALFQGLKVGIDVIDVGIANVVEKAATLGNAFGLVSDASLADLQGSSDQAAEELVKSATSAEQILSNGVKGILDASAAAARGLTTDPEISDGLDALAAKAITTANGLRGALAAQRALGAGVNLDQRGTAAPVTRTKEQEAQLKKLEGILDSINQKEQKRLDPLLGQIAAIEKQIKLVKKLELFSEDEPKRQEAILRLERQRAELQTQLAQGRADEASLLNDIGSQLARLSTLDRDRARALQDELTQILTENVGVESIVPKLRDFLKGIQDDVKQLAPPAGKALGQVFADGAKAGLRAALTGDDTFSFIDFFATNLADFTLEQMTAVFEKLSNTVEDLFNKASSSLFGDSGLGSGFGAALGIAASIGLQALKGTESSVSNGLVKSAVTSSQAVRGVVAGPTEIPIFQLGAEIEDAFVETNGILREILVAIRSTATGFATAVGATPNAILGTTSASLA